MEGESPRAIQLSCAGGVLQRTLKEASRHSKEPVGFLLRVRDIRYIHQLGGILMNSSGLSALRVKRASRTAPLK